MNRFAVTVLALVILAANSAADMLDNAQAFLASVGLPTPPGFTVSWGEVEGGGPAATDFRTGEITISPDGILAMSPNLDGDVTQYGGIIVVILYHEYKHADGSYDDGVGPGDGTWHCQEVALNVHVAEKHCELVQYILNGVPNADLEPLCTFYSDVQNCFNNGCITDGGQAKWNEHSCAGPFPGPIPSCVFCFGDED